MLQFRPVVTLWANEYFFLQNLSRWSSQTREEYNKVWREKLPALPFQIEQLVAQFSRIHRRYPYGPRFLGRPFFTRRDPTRSLRLLLKPQEYITIIRSFDAIRKWFNIIYRHDLPLLLQWQRMLGMSLNTGSRSKQLFSALCSLYGTRPRIRSVRVHLLLSGPNSTGGQANLIDRHTIFIECSRFPRSRLDHIVGIVWHEITHLCLERQQFIPLLDATLPNSQERRQVKEMTAAALLPRGLLTGPAQSRKPTPGPGVAQRLAQELRPYLRSRRPLDAQYIQSAAKILKKEKTASGGTQRRRAVY